MATTYEHIYAIQNLLESGAKSDDSSITDKLVLHYLNISRILLLKRKADKKQKFNLSDFQSFCLPLCEDTWIDCDCIPDNLGCKVLKGKFKIPKALTSRSNIYLTVRLFSGKELGRTNLSAMNYRKYSISKKNKPAWFIDNNYLYVIGIPFNLLKSVYVTGVFEDPTSISDITTCGEGEEPCYNILEEEYPISGELIEPMYNMTLKYLTESFKYPQDNTNNALDENFQQ